MQLGVRSWRLRVCRAMILWNTVTLTWPHFLTLPTQVLSKRETWRGASG